MLYGQFYSQAIYHNVLSIIHQKNQIYAEKMIKLKYLTVHGDKDQLIDSSNEAFFQVDILFVIYFTL